MFTSVILSLNAGFCLPTSMQILAILRHLKGLYFSQNLAKIVLRVVSYIFCTIKMSVVRKTGGVKEFHDSGDVEPLEPERAKKIEQGYKEARARRALHY